MVSTHVLSFAALLSLKCLVTPTEQYQCLEKCQCLWSSGKLMADCQGLSLNDVPKTATTDSSGKQDSAEEIQVINLTRNNLVELKSGVFSAANLVNLQRISLSRVGLETVDANAFHRLANLIDLDMSGNALKHIPSESFAPLIILSKLDLSANQISSVQRHAFAGLSKLKILSLNLNRVSFIDSQAFVGLKSLETLKLSGNQLSNIDSTCLVPLEKLHSLTLSDNPWQCDCKMRSLRKYFAVNSQISIPDEPKCAQQKYGLNNSNKNTKSRKVWTNMDLNAFVCPPAVMPAINEKINSSLVELNATEGSTLVLECALPFDGDDTTRSHSPSINWYWNNHMIHNNSKTCSSFVCQSSTAASQQQQTNSNGSVATSDQYFIITNSIEYDNTNRNNNNNRKKQQQMQAKLEISRLIISSVLVFNSGPYYCEASNSAGNAQKNFAVNVLPANVMTTNASANAESRSTINYNSIMTSGVFPANNDNQTDRVVIGLVIGIFFGIFLVLAIIAVTLFVVCRRRVDRVHHRNGTSTITKINGTSTRSAKEDEDCELEKLTPNSMTATIYNPIQKPPRLIDRANNMNNDGIAKTPEVWLIKRNNNGGTCGTPLIDDDNGYGSRTPIDNDEHHVYVEPDLIHQSSAYVRINKQQLVNDLDLDEPDISYELRWN